MLQKNPDRRRVLKPTHILILSFMVLIFIGTILLMLPQATIGARLSIVDAFFTATSASCVTGLVVVDTGTTFTLFGQIVILALIQIGGLGIMTLSTFFMFLLIGQFSLFDQDIIQETLTQKPIKNLANFLRIIFLFTILVELIGAFVLSLRFIMTMPFHKAIYYGVFHSVSAYCNAGFALFPDSFITYKSDILINFTLMALIIIGGLGFIVVLDLNQYFRYRRHGMQPGLSVYTKIVLSMTGTLIIFGSLGFYIFEIRNGIENFPVGTRLVVSMFQSVTTRTAGFNSIDFAGLSNATIFLFVILMFIGASSGSCGGGIKTSTFGILIAFLVAKFKNQTDVNFFKRRISNDIIARTVSITFFSIVVISIFTLVLLMSEVGEISHQQSRSMFLEILFEVVSAFGTVGLSTGITATLSFIGKILVSMLMFIGRLGPLTLALAIGGREQLPYRYPKENLLVG
ncbi:Trk family potassium uptake protein [candidate division KSB1 bacterium]|nr:Trk family potassium uptake protein [candidate division KSB1 bacterium]